MAGKKQDDKKGDKSAPRTEPTELDLEALDQLSRNLMQASLTSQKLMSEVVQKALEGETVLPKADPFNSAPEFGEVWNHIAHQPELMMQAQAELMKGYIDLWSNTTRRVMAGEAPPPSSNPKRATSAGAARTGRPIRSSTRSSSPICSTRNSSWGSSSTSTASTRRPSARWNSSPGR